MLSNETFLQIFAGTLSADKATREQAEATLAHISKDPHFVIQLIHFSCQQCPNDDSVFAAEMRQACHAASIRLRNVLGRSDWNRQPYFTEEVKSAVRSCIVPLQCELHVQELLRRQLLAATRELIAYDFPQRWPTLMGQLRAILDECVVGFSTSSNVEASPEAAAVRLKSALCVLQACCKVYEDPVTIDADAFEEFTNTLCPFLVELTEMLTSMWVQELTALHKYGVSGSINKSNENNENKDVDAFSFNLSCDMRKESTDMFFISTLHTELSHCLRVILKCFHSLIAVCWPHSLCDETAMLRFCGNSLCKLIDTTNMTLLPLYRQRILAENSDYSEFSSMFNESAVWKLLKWVGAICLKIMQELMLPKSCERRARVAARYFCQHYLLHFVQRALDVVRWHAVPRHLTSKAYIMSLEILRMALDGKAPYCGIIAPNAEEIITTLIFPRLAFSAEDAELWALNPVEYVRLQTNPAEDLYSAKVVSAGLLLSIVLPTRTFHDSALVHYVVQYVLERLAANVAAAAHGETEAARVVDAALFTIYQFRKALQDIGFGDEKVEWLLTNHVAPVLKYQIGFLRARSVLVLSAFAPKIQWSSPSAFQHVLSDVIPLLQDSELPVQIQTCSCFASLICHPHARDVITPCIGDIIQHYFNAMRLMDSEAVVRTLRKTIRHYRGVLSQWVLQLTELLVRHFDQLLQKSIATELTGSASETFSFDKQSGGKNGVVFDASDDVITDSIMAADEVVETLITLVRALPVQQHTSSSFADASNERDNVEQGNSDLVVQLQERVGQMLYSVLSRENGGCFGFMEASLKLLTTILSRSSTVESSMWRLLPCIHQIVLHGAIDYFEQLLPPLDNFVSVAPSKFLLFSLNELCVVPEFATNIASMTPAQIVCAMCDAVLKGANLLRLCEISPVPKLYDAVLQGLWRLKYQKEKNGYSDVSAAVNTTPADGLVEYIIQTALSVLNDPASFTRRRRGLTMLFANSIFSALLANTALAVTTLIAAGAFVPFFVHYVKLAQEDSMQALLRSYDRRLCVMAVAALVQLLVERVELSAAVDEVLCGILQSELLDNFSHREGVLVAAELEKSKAYGSSGSVDSSDDSNYHSGGDDSDEWGEDDEVDCEYDGCYDDDDTSDISDDYDGNDFGDTANDGNCDLQSRDSKLKVLLEATTAARRKMTAKDTIDNKDNDYSNNKDGIVSYSGNKDDDCDDDEYNLLDESDFVSPIDECNAWVIFLNAVDRTTASSAAFQFCELVRAPDSLRRMNSLLQVAAMVEQLTAARERRYNA